ncbi:MAG: ArsA family ATPase [Calditrichaeota bacterium]|nr:ArsA family ATPase [Calditrichota bacterium]
MRTIFFLGKGGVGKSTLAALTAIALSRQNRKVILLSLDRAHNLKDIIGTKINKDIARFLKIVEANPDEFIQQYLRDSEKQLRKNYRYLTALNLEQHFKILRYAPGMEEHGLLLAYRHFLNSAKTVDFLIADMPPTALALKFFGLPSVSLVWLNQLLILRQQILERKEIITRVKFGKEEIETDKVKNNLERQKEHYQAILNHFKDSSECWINVVTNTDSVSIAETARILEFFKEMDFSVKNLFVNKSPLNWRMPPDFPLKLDRNVKILPESDFPLIGLENLERYLTENIDVMLTVN